MKQLLIALISIPVILFGLMCLAVLVLFASCRESPKDVREGTHKIEKVLKSSGINPIRVYSSGKWLNEAGHVNVDITFKKKDINKYLLLKNNESRHGNKITITLSSLGNISEEDLFDALDSKQVMLKYSAALTDLNRQEILNAIVAKKKGEASKVFSLKPIYTIRDDGISLTSFCNINTPRTFSHFVNIYNTIYPQFHYVKDKNGYDELVPRDDFDKNLLIKDFHDGYLRTKLTLNSSTWFDNIDPNILKHAKKYGDYYYVNNEALNKYVTLSRLPQGVEVIVNGDYHESLVNEDYIKNEGLSLSSE